jgi:hypothetical protein
MEQSRLTSPNIQANLRERIIQFNHELIQLFTITYTILCTAYEMTLFKYRKSKLKQKSETWFWEINRPIHQGKNLSLQVFPIDNSSL